MIESILEAQKDNVMSMVLSDTPMHMASQESFGTRTSMALKTRSLGFDLLFEAARNEALRTRMTEIYGRSHVELVGNIERLERQGIIEKNGDVDAVVERSDCSA